MPSLFMQTIHGLVFDHGHSENEQCVYSVYTCTLYLQISSFKSHPNLISSPFNTIPIFSTLLSCNMHSILIVCVIVCVHLLLLYLLYVQVLRASKCFYMNKTWIEIWRICKKKKTSLKSYKVFAHLKDHCELSRRVHTSRQRHDPRNKQLLYSAS